MKNIFKLLLVLSLSLNAQSFYDLSGIKSYDNLLVSGLDEMEEDYNSEIESLMESISTDLGVNTKTNSSSVLAILISKFSVGDTVAYKVNLELGEYVNRKANNKSIFVLSYKDTSFVDESSLEDSLVDTVEEMLEKFATQFRTDNKPITKKVKVTHENFAKVMGYEVDYNVALQKAKEVNKPLMVFMITNYCPWCRKFENRVLIKDDIHQAIKKNFIPVMLNYNVKRFPKSLQKINFTPSMYILNQNSEKIDQQFIGYSSKDEFISYIKQD